MASNTTPDQEMLTELRRRRAELRDSMGALEQALAAPVPGREGLWAERVHVALVELAGDFREHIDITESDHGLYREVLTSAPRLSGAVTRLTREHTTISDLVADLLASVAAPGRGLDVQAVRDRGTALIATLAHHRQRGSDLLYEAYESDIGGET